MEGGIGESLTGNAVTTLALSICFPVLSRRDGLDTTLTRSLRHAHSFNVICCPVISLK